MDNHPGAPISSFLTLKKPISYPKQYLVEQELLTLPDHLSSSPVFCRVHVAQSLVFYVVVFWLTIVCLLVFFYLGHCLSSCLFYFGHCIACPSLIYISSWLSIWHLQTFLLQKCKNVIYKSIKTQTKFVHNKFVGFK